MVKLDLNVSEVVGLYEDNYTEYERFTEHINKFTREELAEFIINDKEITEEESSIEEQDQLHEDGEDLAEEESQQITD